MYFLVIISTNPSEKVSPLVLLEFFTPRLHGARFVHTATFCSSEGETVVHMNMLYTMEFFQLCGRDRHQSEGMVRGAHSFGHVV